MLKVYKTKDYPSTELVIQKIRECGGLAFYPHLFIYKWADDRKGMINELLEKYSIDGELLESANTIDYFKKQGFFNQCIRKSSATGKPYKGFLFKIKENEL